MSATPRAGHADRTAFTDLHVPMLARTRNGLAAARAATRSPVVLVPTMGALHDGHRSLLRVARDIAGEQGSVVVSIFVNPLQFGPEEDFASYPRALDADLAVCTEAGVNLVFAPDRSQMYPTEPVITVNPGPLGRMLEGKSRPGFFEGVLTVVLKLLHLVTPEVAVFGAKDAQQLALIRQMVTDLDLGVQIVAAPLRRDQDGLAASSRNAYLSGQQRTAALALSSALAAARAAQGSGATAALAAAAAVIEDAAAGSPPVQLDYLALVDPQTFADIGAAGRGAALLLVAANVGSTRLIDNAILDLGRPAAGSPAQTGDVQ